MATTDNKNLAIVVVTYNRLQLLEQCLQKLEKQTYPIDNLIVVNNASTDGITAGFLDIIVPENHLLPTAIKVAEISSKLNKKAHAVERRRAVSQ